MAEYVTIQELKDLGLNPAAFDSVDVDKKLRAIRAKSDVIDGYLGRFTLPLLSWGDDLRSCCAVLASISLIKNRGTNPDDRDAFDTEEARWITWLTNVSKGIVTPRVTDSSTGSAVGVTSRRLRIISASQRGFSVRGTGRDRGQFQGD
jgi:phage gp36-like protein